MNKMFKDLAAGDPDLAKHINTAIARHAPALAAYANLTEIALLRATSAQRADAAAETAKRIAIAMGLEGDSEVTELLNRIVQYDQQVNPNGQTVQVPRTTSEWDLDGADPVYKKLAKRFKAHVEGPVYKAGKKDGVMAAGEAAKAAGREGKGPAQVAGKAASKRYTDMSFEERNRLTPEERDRLIAQEG